MSVGGTTLHEPAQEARRANSSGENGDHDVTSLTTREYNSIRLVAVCSHEYCFRRAWPALVSRVRSAESVKVRCSASASALDVVRRNEYGSVTGHLGDGPGCRSDDGNVVTHGFKQRKAESFIERGIRQHLRVPEQPSLRAVVDPSGEEHTLARLGMQRVDCSVDRVAVITIGAGQHQANIGICRGDLIERGHQTGKVLAPLERAEREHVRRADQFGHRRG